jgi:hypothetical protein
MDSDEQPTIDWVNFAEGAPTFSLWESLHDGDVLAIESDLLGRTVTMRFDVGYVRKFHQLSEETRFVIVMDGVQSVRSLRSVPWPGGFSVPKERLANRSLSHWARRIGRLLGVGEGGADPVERFLMRKRCYASERRPPYPQQQPSHAVCPYFGSVIWRT